MEKQKMTKEEKSWILYDVANSAFIMTLTATIPIYFRALATEADISATHATSIWGTCTSIAILILALLSPILGALADYQNMKKRIFVIFLAIGIGGGSRRTGSPSFCFSLSHGSVIPPAMFSMMPCWSMSRRTNGWIRFHPSVMHSDTSEAVFRLSPALS